MFLLVHLHSHHHLTLLFSHLNSELFTSWKCIIQMSSTLPQSVPYHKMLWWEYTVLPSHLSAFNRGGIVQNLLKIYKHKERSMAEENKLLAVVSSKCSWHNSDSFFHVTGISFLCSYVQHLCYAINKVSWFDWCCKSL